jgi:hypothetical protein
MRCKKHGPKRHDHENILYDTKKFEVITKQDFEFLKLNKKFRISETKQKISNF